MQSTVFLSTRFTFFCVSCVLFLNGPTASAQSVSKAVGETDSNIRSGVMFHETENVIPLEQRSRRKWDSPIIADFDQDGHLDVLLTDHGYRASIFWNNGGKFSKPKVVIHGDTHGVAVGDYDHDGRIDLIVQRGGGDGNNPRNPVSFHINRDRSIEKGGEFEHFERSRGRVAKLVDCNNNGKLDLILTGYPLETQKDTGANHLYENNGDGQFEFSARLPKAAWMGDRLQLTDVNNDGDFDVIIHGGNDIVGAEGGEGVGFSQANLGALGQTSFARGVANIDFDNDGDFDLFVTRADHPFANWTFYDAGEKRFAFAFFRKKIQYEDLEIDGDFIIENLQMAFPHFDVFVGADKRLISFSDESVMTQDRHGEHALRLKQEEAEGWPTDLSKKGLYVGHVGDGVWRVAGDTQAKTAGVILNVISTPDVEAPQEMPATLFENRDGLFVDVTEQVGISIPEQTTSAVTGDFDNNGWTDLFVVREGNAAKQNEQILYLNQGDRTFAKATNHAVVSKELGATGGEAEAFDFDEDGDLDLIYSNERGRWHLFENEISASDSGNYVVVKVGSSPSKNAAAGGAVLTLKAGGKVHRRIVGDSSAAFGHSMNTHLHVGLGELSNVEEAEVRWTNGETETLNIDGVNQSVPAGRLN